MVLKRRTHSTTRERPALIPEGIGVCERTIRYGVSVRGAHICSNDVDDAPFLYATDRNGARRSKKRRRGNPTRDVRCNAETVLKRVGGAPSGLRAGQLSKNLYYTQNSSLGRS